jgi:hypothetical protein
MVGSVPMLRTMARPANHPVITPARLVAIGEALFGAQWQTPLAEALGVTARQVRYLAAGERPFHRALAGQLAQVCKVRAAAIVRLGRELEGSSK